MSQMQRWQGVVVLCELQASVLADAPVRHLSVTYSALAKFFGYDDPFANLPHLRAFHTNFAALPDNARYLASPLHTKLPFNNKMAVFGAVPGGGRWSPGTACDWHDLSGVF